ncbi:N-acetyl-gamma-glutamyl-phosphate reductase [Helicobacter sp. MIT 14-3879]|uniref:N-acetyl-gamma-glutamyl-phosphate reductase n=1 Tax=Helicobacter sp. MIT 14-3879 TaxID=2040649 RepID=UPI000E1E5ADC|nr:N-acetyl-gamma-glutamyl-phosphate reductase [Helicobacter sp. MIT 14-3879]RDU64711.1 N-acetyl-gamma-glutamyl-phosphate reductase [Helicobacter sp. MIT 14-3879]
MTKIIQIGIIGISGYTGLELIKMLINHKYFKISYLANTTGKENLYQLYPSLINSIKNLPIKKFDINSLPKLDLVFLALPHKESMKIVPNILANNIKVIDLSADYRLNEENYNMNYCKHLDSDNLENAVYGLVEWNRKSIKNAKLIANPGCYPTASLLGILPFINYLDESSVFIDAKSGVSGAGKNLSDNTHYPNINDNMFSYSPLKHRHNIEIMQKCKDFGNRDIKVNFVPHLSPFTRGMLVSIFARLKEPINLFEVLEDSYKNEPFIRISKKPVSVKNTAGTHFCDIFVINDELDLYINISIDNLLRGASSQALVCANLMFDIEETHSIPKIAYVP